MSSDQLKPLPSSDPLHPDSENSISRWSWGAFFFHWIWGIFNGCPISFLWFIPVVGPIVMPFVLGAKGNEWAWKNKVWQDEAHFHQTQKKWACAALIVFLINFVFGLLITTASLLQPNLIKNLKISSVTNLFQHPEAPVYGEVLMQLGKDAEILKELGEPLKKGKVLRVRVVPSEDNLKSDVFAEFEVIGALKPVRVYAEATVDTGVVFLKQLVLYFKDPQRKVWQIPYYRDPPAAA